MQACIPRYKNIINHFIAVSSFKRPAYQHEEEFEQEVIRGCTAVQDPLKRERLARLGAKAAKSLYPSHSREAQIVIATFSALMFSVDDLGKSFPDALRSYREKLILGQPQENKQVADFLKLTFQMKPWLDNFAVDMVFKAQLEFLSANLVENEHGQQICPNESTPHFVRNYFRLKTGICEAYAFFVWPSETMAKASPHACTPLAVMPDLMTWIDDANDLMSFYKESVVGNEQDNAVHLHARALGLTPIESLKLFQESAISSLRRIQEFAKIQQEDIRRKLEEFINGYIGFHLNNPRYRLKELDLVIPNK